MSGYASDHDPDAAAAYIEAQDSANGSRLLKAAKCLLYAYLRLRAELESQRGR